jgi:LytS/YehU family sensor histidine kinase
MSRTSLGTLLGLGLAALVATRFDGSVRVGILGGALFGAALGLFAGAWLRHVAATRPERVLAAMVHGFLFKLGGVVLAALALRFVEPAARVADWRAFVLAYTALVFVAVLLAATETAKALNQRSAT